MEGLAWRFIFLRGDSLIPHTLAEEIRTYGRAIETMDIVRVRGNRFRIVVTLRPGTHAGYGS